MIRVNLLPHAAERRSGPETSQAWLLVVMGVVVLEVIGLFFFHQTREDELQRLQGRVQQLNSEINDIKALVKDHDKIKKELAALRAREDAIAQLQKRRKGPTGIMLELAQLLTAGKGPTASAEELEKRRRANPLDVYNPLWDARRVWLGSYTEAERNVRLEGFARDGGDVYEFAQRLKLSAYFDKVRLLPGGKAKKSSAGVELVAFALQVKVNY